MVKQKTKIPKETLRRMGMYIPPQELEKKVHPVLWPLWWAEKRLERLLGLLQRLALLEILGIIGNVGILFAVVAYIGTEKQRRDAEVFNAWQTITGAYGQSGNGGRIQALEFLNASPANREGQYPGANWRRRSVCFWICTWPAASLEGIDLSVSLEEKGAYLRAVQLRRARLGEADLQNADLGGANFEGAELGDVNLAGANLSAANFEEAYLGDANLIGASLLSANLANINFVGANLQKANLSGTNLHGADLSKANLQGANLANATLTEADLQWADLSGADLEGADLSGVILDFADFDGTNLHKTDLQGIYLYISNSGYTYISADIEKAIFCETILPDGIDIDPNRDCQKIYRQAQP